MQEIPLYALTEGEGATVTALTARGTMRRRLQDIGVTAGAHVDCVGHAPSGDPAAYRICGAVIAIRRADAADVLVCREACDAP